MVVLEAVVGAGAAVMAAAAAMAAAAVGAVAEAATKTRLQCCLDV